MGMFFADDSYDESRRMEGFQRYKQLLSFYAGRWVKVNLLTTLGALPLVLGAALLQVGLRPVCALDPGSGALCGAVVHSAGLRADALPPPGRGFPD